MSSLPGMLTVPQAAQELQVSRYTVYRLINNRELQAVKVGPRSTRINREDLEKFVEGRRAR